MLDHRLFVERNYGLKARNLSYFATESDKRYEVAMEKEPRTTM